MAYKVNHCKPVPLLDLHCLPLACLQVREHQKQLHVHEKTTHASRMNALTAGRRKEIVSPNLPEEVTAKDTSHLDDAEFVLATTRGEYRVHSPGRAGQSCPALMHLASLHLYGCWLLSDGGEEGAATSLRSSPPIAILIHSLQETRRFLHTPYTYTMYICGGCVVLPRGLSPLTYKYTQHWRNVPS